MSFAFNYNYKIHPRGFTLTELMITLVIMGILAAVVVPNYTAQIDRAKLSDAVNQLAQLRLSIERVFQNNGTYKDPANVAPCGIVMPAGHNFTFTCSSTDSTYILTAKSLAGQGLGAAGDYEYRINESGAMQTIAYGGVDYPADPATTGAKNCWLIKINDC